MYPHSPLWYYLWVAPHVLQFAIAGLIFARRLQREIPAFLAYTLFVAVMQATLMVLDHSASVSGKAYWTTDAAVTLISVALRFAVIYEVASHVFRSYMSLQALSRVVHLWTAVVLLLVAVAVSAYAPGKDSPLFAGILALDRGVGLIQSGLLLFLFIFSSYFHLSWRSYIFGIAAGLGVFSTVDLAVAAIRIARGPAAGGYILDFVSMAAYHCSVLIWLIYLLLPEPRQPSPPSSIPEDHLEEWNRELERFLHK